MPSPLVALFAAAGILIVAVSGSVWVSAAGERDVGDQPGNQAVTSPPTTDMDLEPMVGGARRDDGERPRRAPGAATPGEQSSGGRGGEAGAPSPERSWPEVTTRSARLVDSVDTAVPSPPRRLEIPAIGVDMEVVDVGLDADRNMDIPPNVRTAGWYRFGPTVGAAAGSAVISAHVDTESQGPGPFSRLQDLAVGDSVDVTRGDGPVVSYRVTARRVWGKDEVPLDEVFRRDGDHVLALITCGGAFDGASRRYADNVVVFAVPVDPRAGIP